LIDAMPTSDDCIITKLNRRAFVEDLLSKGFPAPVRPPHVDGGAQDDEKRVRGDDATRTTATIDNTHVVLLSRRAQEDDEEEEETLCLDSDLGDIGVSSPKKTQRVVVSQKRLLRNEGGNGSHSSATSGDDYDSDGTTTAFPYDSTVSRLISDDVWPRVFRQFELDVARQELLVESQRYTTAPDAYRAIRQMMHSAIVQKLLCEQQRRAQRLSTRVTSKAWSFVSPILGKTLQRLRGGTSSGDGEPAPLDNATPDVYSEELMDAAERMTRLVVLLSQQSVMGLPFEELYHRYLSDMDRVLHLDSDASHNGAMFVHLTLSPAGSSASSTSEPGSLVSCESSFASVNGGVGHVGGAAAPTRQTATSHPPPSLFERPSPSRFANAALVPTLRIHKRFRVFEVFDEDNPAPPSFRPDNCGGIDQTLFTIDTDLVFDLFAPESVPIVMRWTIEYPSPRRVSVKDRSTHHRGHGRSKEVSANSTVIASSLDCLTYIPHGSQLQADVAPSSESFPERICDCLGGPYGFHRPDCRIVKACLSSCDHDAVTTQPRSTA
jgi:hypothetical protein